MLRRCSVLVSLLLLCLLPAVSGAADQPTERSEEQLAARSPSALAGLLPAGGVGGMVADLAVAGRYVFVAQSENFVILDAINLAQPRIIASLQLSDVIGDIDIVNGLAYVAAGSAGLLIFDVQRPDQPILRGVVASSFATRVHVVDGRAYIGGSVPALAGATLDIVDIRNPAAPVPLGRYTSPESITVNDLRVVGDTAYLLVSAQAPRGGPGAFLETITVQTPSAPARRGRIEVGSFATSLDVSGSLVFIASSNVAVIDVSNPAAPFLRALISNTDEFPATDVQIRGPLAYITAGLTGGLQIWDISNLARPLLKGKLNNNGMASRVEVVGPIAYVGDGADGLTFIDVSSSVNPIERGRFIATSRMYAVDVADGMAYVGTDAFFQGFLQIYDVRQPEHPQLRGTIGGLGRALDIQVVGATAYIADDQKGLVIVDARDPALPVKSGRFAVNGFIYGLDVVDRVAYLAVGSSTTSARGLYIIDVADPAAPTLLGTYHFAESPRHVRVVGTNAYVAGGLGGLFIINVADPRQPTLRSQYSHTQLSIEDVDVQGTTAYVTYGSAYFERVDVSNPDNPRHIGQNGDDVAEYTVEQIDVVGTNAYTIGQGVVQVFSVTDPETPIPLATQRTTGSTEEFAIAGGHVFIADGLSGLRILRYVAYQSSVFLPLAGR